MTDIKNYETFVKIEPINEGLSKDKKYYIETVDGQRLLLRVSDIERYEHKKAEFERMKRMDTHNIPMSRPVDFGLCDDGKSVYQLLTWCDGENLYPALLMLTETEQYVFGVKAGEILRKIHSVPVSENDVINTDWHERYSNFMDGSLKAFHECGVKIYGAKIIFDYFHKYRHLLESRPQCYLHNDYHVGNMMFSTEHELTVVDWEILLYNNYGDPWMEISMQETPHFSTGMIDGYFNGEVPEDYWRILAFYTSIGAISAIPWAYYGFPDKLDEIKNHVADVLKWFDNMNNTMPTWYLKDFYN